MHLFDDAKGIVDLKFAYVESTCGAGHRARPVRQASRPYPGTGTAITPIVLNTKPIADLTGRSYWPILTGRSWPILTGRGYGRGALLRSRQPAGRRGGGGKSAKIWVAAPSPQRWVPVIGWLDFAGSPASKSVLRSERQDNIQYLTTGYLEFDRPDPGSSSARRDSPEGDFHLSAVVPEP
jgi:hypothetical protein